MSRLTATLRDVLAAIPIDRPFALVGLAVSARTEPRFTRDLDFAVAVTNDPEAEEVVYNLQRVGYLVAATIEQTVLGASALCASSEIRSPRSSTSCSRPEESSRRSPPPRT